jgi:hypothetical protein
MKIIIKALNLDLHNYYVTHLNILNAIFPVKLTPKEIEVLAVFISFEGDLAELRFSTTGRKIVKQRLNISDGGLGNYINSLKEKRFIREGTNGLYIIPLVFPESKEQSYQFKLTKIESK